MIRSIDIQLKENQFTYYAAKPLVTNDVNAYQLIITAPYGDELIGAAMKITAIKQDESFVVDSTQINDAKATYTLKNNMYNIAGTTTLRISFIKNGCELTDCEIIFDVLDGINADSAVGASNQLPVLTSLIDQVRSAISSANTALDEAEEFKELAEDIIPVITYAEMDSFEGNIAIVTKENEVAESGSDTKNIDTYILLQNFEYPTYNGQQDGIKIRSQMLIGNNSIQKRNFNVSISAWTEFEDVNYTKEEVDILIEEINKNLTENYYPKEGSVNKEEFEAAIRSIENNYVKNTDYATGDKAGIVKVGNGVGSDGNTGVAMYANGQLHLVAPNDTYINTKYAQTSRPIMPSKIDLAVRAATHQDMSDTYKPEDAVNVGGVKYEYGGSQPVSYDAVKTFIDTFIKGINARMNSLDDEKADKDDSVYELIEEITVDTEGITTITRTEEPDGTPYSFKAVLIKGLVTAGTTSGLLNIYTYDKDARLLGQYSATAIQTSERYLLAETYKRHGLMVCEMATNTSKYATTTQRMAGTDDVIVTEDTRIKAIKFFTNNNMALPVGSTFKIYGVR